MFYYKDQRKFVLGLGALGLYTGLYNILYIRQLTCLAE